MKIFSLESFSLLLSSLSAIAVIITIIYEGKIRDKKKKKLSKHGWALLIVSILMCAGNGFLTFQNIRNNNIELKKSQEKNNTDSIKYTKLINATDLIKLKNDSIKYSVVDNAAKSLEEQRKFIEGERQNIFIHLQKEIKDNLLINLGDYKESIKIKDSAFTRFKLKDVYIDKYQNISNRKIIITFLMTLSKDIKISNEMLDVINSPLEFPNDVKERNSTIDQFKINNDGIFSRLYSIYKAIDNLKSYKEYEALDFTKKVSPVDKEQLLKKLQFEAGYYVHDKEELNKLLKQVNIK